MKCSETPKRKYTRKEAVQTRPSTQKAAKRKHANLEKSQPSTYGGFKNTALKNLHKEAQEQTPTGA